MTQSKQKLTIGLASAGHWGEFIELPKTAIGSTPCNDL